MVLIFGNQSDAIIRSEKLSKAETCTLRAEPAARISKV